MNIGDLIPDMILRSVAHDGMQDQKLHSLFQSKRVLIICVPGAFTSTCHTRHLPPYIKGDTELLSKKNIDLICCITTNDPFVLDLWRKELGESKILFLSDGNHEFLKKSNLIRNHDKSFMGDRLIRSVILVNNLKIEKFFFDKPGELKETSFENISSSL